MRVCRRSRLEEYSHYIIIYRYFESINICCAARLMETAAAAAAERTDAKSRGKEREKKTIRFNNVRIIIIIICIICIVIPRRWRRRMRTPCVNRH